MDAIYPGTFNLSKVKWNAKFDYEFVENYKVLQNAFDKNGIKKHIDVSKITGLLLVSLQYILGVYPNGRMIFRFSMSNNCVSVRSTNS